jgi:PAS domain S-box-containing protein
LAPAVLDVFARSANPISLLTLDRRYVAINRAGVTLLGRSRDQIVGRRIDTMLVPDELGSVDAEWRALEHRGVFDGERSVLTPGGQRVVVQYGDAEGPSRGP